MKYRLFIIVIIVVLVVAVIAGFLLRIGKQPISSIPVTIPEDQVAPSAAVVLSEDADGDGLSNEKEQEIGTDAHNPDTDGDGLFDWQEVNVYETNPLIVDTDGDGYSDSDEIKSGYSPTSKEPLRLEDE